MTKRAPVLALGLVVALTISAGSVEIALRSRPGKTATRLEFTAPVVARPRLAPPAASRKTAPRVVNPAVPGVSAPVSCPAAPTVSAADAVGAQALRKEVHIYSAPGGGLVRTLRNPWDGERLSLLVVERQGDWVRVKMPVRPSGTTGWAKVSELAMYAVPSRVVVELCAHRLTAYRNGVVVLQERVAVGSSRYPTPVGDFYINYTYQPGRRNCCGPWILSVAAFSAVLLHFDGGIGQIAIHGWRDASAMGRSVSHGCVRMTHEAVTRLVGLVESGTPVTISP